MKASPIAAITVLAVTLGFAACSSSNAGSSDASTPVLGDTGLLTPESWNADLDFLLATLESKHPNPWHAVSRDDFSRALYAPIDLAQSTERIARARIYTVARALALMGEGHTSLIGSVTGSRAIPLMSVWLHDGFYVMAAPRSAAALLGAKITSIEGIPIGTVYEKLTPYLSSEGDEFRRVLAPSALANMDLLQEAGVASRETTGIVVEGEANASAVQARIEAFAAEEMAQQMGASVSYFQERSIQSAESMSRGREAYWFRMLPEQKAVFVQYNSCKNMPQYPFADFCRDLFAAIEANKPERLVLDLRRNTGGNSGLFTFQFLPRIASSYLNQPGAIRVLVGNAVYSSGIFAVADMTNATSALLLGEPTGQGYNHYGFTAEGKLPESGLEFIHSTRYFDIRPGDARNTIVPDVLLPVDAASFLAGRDNQLEAALATDTSP